MLKRHLYNKKIFAYLLSLLLTISCSSGPKKRTYYNLNLSAEAKTSQVDGSPNISIRYVNVPAYLKQKNIARLEDNGKISLSYEDQWIEKIPAILPKIIARELEAKLKEPVITHPIPHGLSVDNILEIDIDEFIADNKTLEIAAKYRLIGKNTIHSKYLLKVIDLENPSQEAVIDKMEEAISILTDDIVKLIKDNCCG